MTTPVVDLRPPANLVSRKAVLFWATRAAIGWVVVLVGGGVWLALTGWFPLVVALIVAGVLAVAHLAVMPQWRFRVHRWETTPQVVYTQSGWIDQERRIAPVSRIQTVDTERGPLERLFGLANLTVTTASARGPVQIHGLDYEVAQRLTQELATLTQATPGDAT
ncbi:PH domain-containing protein [Amycolatopsis thermalba]|uniref:PH domain-containing protein n=1 Tax=Amycolatopsis thermalba TaxID=944492 RepID=A0ABY4P4H0_9PSEU|nr:PH domain-containing protein [Amycolatopsis thermalba]UQS27290.1 PH domain-containing protein [Amycolatopsis thermalba]